MAHFNISTHETGCIKPAPLRIFTHLRGLGTRAQKRATTLLRWYQGRVLMADLNDRLLRDGGLERDHDGTRHVIHRRLPETGHFLSRTPRS
ncbi:hypothetical protein J4E05_05170 [Thalassospira sp. NFXS8]|uniref:hypothetical protein n=1 Tax=Thalassospira sp. NFXS8 TaxID=2819093 RepID=UPI0032DE5300